jgi:lipopolysaccharide transport system ATP-binding protein
MSDVRSLCDRAVLLENGSILKDGYPDEVVDYYNALVAAKENEPLSIEQHRDKNGWLLTKSGTGEAEVLNIDLLDAETNKPIKLAKVNQRLCLKTTIRINQNIPNLIIGFQLRDKSGHVVWGTNTRHTKQILEKLSKNQIIDIILQFNCTLGNGSYSFSPALVDLEGRAKTNYEWLDNALIFEVFNTDLDFFIGTSALDYSLIIK